MQAEHDSKTTLAKWPFFLGDFLLVVTALAIAITANWQLSDWQVAYCVAAVALGAALFVLPYIVEFRVRIIEEAQDRGADMRVLNRDLLMTVRKVENLQERMESFESDSAKGTVPVFDSGELLKLEQKLEAMNEKVTLLETAPVLPMPSEAPRKQPPKVELDEPATVASDPAPVSVREMPKRVKPPAVARPKRAPRSRQTRSEPRLLIRAIKENGDGSASAVTRIIESKKKMAVSATEDTPDEAAETKPLASAERKPEPLQSETAVVATEDGDETQLPPGEPPVDDVPAQSDGEEIDEVKPSVQAPAKESGTSTPQSQPVALAPKPAEAPANPKDESAAEGLLFDEDPAPPVSKRKKRVRKKDAAITASVFIGIGNKPYLRGSGAGLSWDKGVAMEFVEIGKWSWIAPEGLDEPIDVKIYRNDEDPDTRGDFRLEAGQKLELSPVF